MKMRENDRIDGRKLLERDRRIRHARAGDAWAEVDMIAGLHIRLSGGVRLVTAEKH